MSEDSSSDSVPSRNHPVNCTQSTDSPSKPKLTNDLETWFSILCTMAGTGILGLPFTLHQGGWLVIGLIVIVAGATNYTGKALVKCLHAVRRRQAQDEETPLTVADKPAAHLGYPEIGQAAYGKLGSTIVHIFHKATLLGVTTLFLILTAKFLLEGIGGGGEGLVKSLGGKAHELKWQRIWCGVSGAVVLVPVLAVRNLGEMAPLAAFGMATSIAVVLVVIVLAITVSPITQEMVRKYDLPGFDAAKPVIKTSVINLSDFPTAFATITLSYGGHAVFPTIEAHMAKPQNFGSVLNKSYVLLTVMYLGCAIAGYAAFGDHVYSPVLCNMPREGSLAVLGQVTKLAVAAHVMSAYPVLMNTAVTELESKMGIDGESKTHLALRTAFRAACVAATTTVAMFVPYFADFMSFVGAACLTMVVFILPVVFSWKLRPEEISTTEKVVGVVIILLGLTGGTIGCYQSVDSIVKKLIKGDTQ